ncbi:metal ABC transporter substrate-binding protein [Gleimia coleocanis]|nr:metal ABC transporter substrate-binding protein [Gleimia coleocanis]
MKNAKLMISALAASALILSACSSSHSEAEHTHEFTVENAKPIENREASQPLNIKTSIYPLQYLVEKIAGDKAMVESLTGPGIDAHSLELSPKTVAELTQADAIIFLDGFQGAVDDAVEQSENPRILDISHIAELADTGAHHHHHDHEGHDHDHADEHKHEESEAGHDHEGHDHEGHDHEHGNLDPHFWLDANRMANAAHEVGHFLSKIDPQNAAEYEANAEALKAELNALGEEMKLGLAKCEINTFVVSHEAFGYLAKQTGLKQVGVSGLDPEATPSPARIEEISHVVKDLGVKTLYVEVNVSPKVLEAAAKDLGITVDVLDPIATQNDPALDYQQMMRKNLQTLQKGQNCQM